MPDISSIAGYWDHYASGVSTETREEAIKHAFGWTQYEGHGPGDELLGDPTTALELGSGHGSAIAALAIKGIDATGIDVSGLQCDHAQARWGDLPDATFERADAIDFLTDTNRRWDAIFSIWGALWFTDPERLLPLIHDRLAPGGNLVFSHAPAVPGSYGIQGIYGNGFKGRQTWLYRWAYEPDTWAAVLRQHGFRRVHARIEPAPYVDHVGTLVVEASS